MSLVYYDEILRREGFEPVGEINYRLRASIWWNPAAEKRLQVLIIHVGASAMLKASKSYHLVSISQQGETWSRDVRSLHDYLEFHFPELCLSFSHFRDVPPALAEQEVRRRMQIQSPTEPPPTVEDVALLQQTIAAKLRERRSTDQLHTLGAMNSPLLSDYIRQTSAALAREVELIAGQLQRQQQRLDQLKHLVREYQEKGSAASYVFAVHSNLHAASNADAFQDALRHAVKELVDLDRHQIRQKLNGGKLNIQIAECDEPGIAWIEQWTAGALSPMQLQRLGTEFESLRRSANRHMMVVPDETVVIDDREQQAAKHLSARVVSSFVERLDRTEDSARRSTTDAAVIAPDLMPLTLGHRLDDSGKTLGPARIPLAHALHISVSGASGSGKSFAARVLVEEAAQYETLSILVIDPRNQSAGLMAPEDRPDILRRYEQFAMTARDARAYHFDYFAPGLAGATPLPKNLAALASARSIVSLKGADDRERCAIAAKILRAIFDACAGRESERPRLLVVLDEAHNFLRKRVDANAKDAAAQFERAIDTLVREGRKLGIIVTTITQRIRDFSRDLASVRQMATTKVFMRNGDTELEFAGDFIGDGGLLAALETGTGMIHHPDWGTMRLRFRPPYSKVFELAGPDIQRILCRGTTSRSSLSTEAADLLAQIRAYSAEAHEPLNVSRAGALAGITSKRKLLELISELEQAGIVRTRTLPARGQPRIIEQIL